MQDLLALSAKYATRPAAEETINNPTVRKHYWRYRCHVELETLLEDKSFLSTLQQLLLSAYCRHFHCFSLLSLLQHIGLGVSCAYIDPN